MANLNVREMAKIAIDKKLCKEYNDASKGVDNFIVYLNDGDEFQIQLFNPTNRVIGAKIKFNNEYKGWTSNDNYIVLRPGERVWLERFLDCHDRFIFNTYEVSNSRQVMEAIRDNGDITVEFYYEDNSRKCDSITISRPNILYSEPFTFAPEIYYGSNISNSGSVVCDTNSCISSANSDCISAVSQILGLTSNASATTTAGSATVNTATYCSGSTYTTTKKEYNSGKSDKTIETGRVEHGSYSGQNFKNVYYDFEYWPFATKNFKLLPVSRKQYSEHDLKKIYCTNCGKKLLSKFKFCPACGTKVNN
jgi:hypothetical protein